MDCLVTGAMKAALYTTFYRAAAMYFAPWYKSVRSQSDRSFDLWIGLDDISACEAQEHTGCGLSASWVENDLDRSPASIRNKAFRMLSEQYAYIILADADDVLEQHRIESAKRALENYDVVACALRLIDQNGRDLNRVFMPNPSVELDEMLPKQNVFGLSNSAYCAETLKRCLPIPHDSVLSDWFLATGAWCGGARLYFDDIPQMRYRQHPSNTAQIMLPFSAPQVLSATKLVLTHYSHVLSAPWSASSEKIEKIRTARMRAEHFYEAIASSPDCLAEYVSALNKLKPRYVWWWCVANPDLEILWTN
jgi:hypothetical protein